MESTSTASAGLTISEAARLAGVTTRAVRHYHSIGLLPEPARDSSGYRRYHGRDVIDLVRVVRLRGLGMPLGQISERMADSGGDQPALPTALRTLADEMDREIQELTRTRDMLRELASNETFDQPVRTLTEALRGHGLLGPSDELRSGEGWAAALLDALHPQGMPGVLDGAGDLLNDPAAIAALRRRFRALGGKGADATTEEIAALADEVAGALPPAPDGAQLVDIDMLDKLLAGRMNPSQQRFMRELRARLGERGAHTPGGDEPV